MQTLDSLFNLIYDHRELLGTTRQEFAVWIEQGTIETGSQRETDQGLHFCDYRYSLALQIDAMHAHRGGLLLAMLHNWASNLNRDDLSAPQVNLTNVTGQNGRGKILEVEYTLEVRDPVYLVPSDTGPVFANGQQWTFGEATPLAIADTFGVSQAVRT